MKSIISLLAVVIFVGCNPIKEADRKASSAEVKTIYPTQTFDSLLAKKMLSPGNATIKGVIYKKTNKMALVGGKTYGQNVTIELFPATPYLLEWHDLKEKKEDQHTKVYASQEAYKYRRYVISDGYGRFAFDNIRPGKYYLQASLTTTKSYLRDVEVGSNSYGTKYFQKERYSSSKNHFLEKFVEVNAEREIVEIILN